MDGDENRNNDFVVVKGIMKRNVMAGFFGSLCVELRSMVAQRCCAWACVRCKPVTYAFLK